MKGKARMFFFFRFICVLAALVIIPCVAYADVPGTISYQGYLEDSEDNPLNETVSMVFKIYDADGAVKWTETHDAVDVNDGVFSVILGETTAVSTDVADDKRYLGVTVESNEEMAPRQKLNSVMFAIRAESVAAKAVGTEEIADNAVTSSKINNNAVTSEKIVSGAALKNLGGGSTTSKMILCICKARAAMQKIPSSMPTTREMSALERMIPTPNWMLKELSKLPVNQYQPISSKLSVRVFIFVTMRTARIQVVI